jgi:hypothetical protein
LFYGRTPDSVKQNFPAHSGPQRQKKTCAFNRQKVDIWHGQRRSADKYWLPRREKVPLFAAAVCALAYFEREQIRNYGNKNDAARYY